MLSAQLREILSECNRTRRQSPRMIQGGTQPGRENLRGRIRAWLAAGRLPMPGAEMWVGAGSDHACVICSAPITRAQIEYEIPAGDGWLHVHLACFTIWKSEAASLRPNPSADGAAAAAD